MLWKGSRPFAGEQKEVGGGAELGEGRASMKGKETILSQN